LLRDGHGKSMTASGDQHDLDAGGVGSAERCKIVFRDVELGIEQSAIDIGGEEADGIGLRASGCWLRRQSSGLHSLLLHSI
jgi:hypothetical protein